MINSDDFAKRLEKVMEYYGESASSFAEKIGVQRSSISHILSGRNKPSLDFVLKVLSVYQEVELYWFLNGKGSFPISSDDKKNDFENQTSKNEISLISSKNDKSIERIVIFYTDGTFKNFNQS